MGVAQMLHNIPSIRLTLAVLVMITLAGFDTSAATAQAMPEHGVSRHGSAAVGDVVRDPADVPPPVGQRPATTVKAELVAQEVVGELDPASGTSYRYWTFNGKVPGPMIRVRQGDMVEVTLHNEASSHMVHSIDFHAALGPGGGAALTQVLPGHEKTFTFQATTPGLFVYHCGTPMIADHIANGMYGLILVEPPGGLPRVDHEYYVMQGELYTAAPKGKAGLQSFSEAKLMQESPEYFVFNGAVDALTKKHPLRANTGETVRIFFGDAGPNATSSLHVVGEIFTHDYVLGSLTSPPVNGVQTASVPPGAAAILELKAVMPGQFNFMDHAMARMAKGLMGTLSISGTQDNALMHAGPASTEVSAGYATVSGMTQADTVAAAAAAAESRSVPASAAPERDEMPGMVMEPTNDAMQMGHSHMADHVPAASHPTGLNGCLSYQSDGKVMLKLFHSEKSYRLEAQPLLFGENANHLVHVTGHLGSVLPAEDSQIASFVVDTLDELAPNCSTRVSPAVLLKRIQARKNAAEQPEATTTVGMGDMQFLKPDIVVDAGQTVTWKNTSLVVHNVVADPAKALVAADIRLPHGARTFDSGYLQPGQIFAYKFTVPGVYRYVCTLHESGGMKGVVIVKAPGATKLASATPPAHE